MYRYLILISVFLLDSCSPRLIALPDPTAVNPPAEVPVIIQTPDTQRESIVSLAVADLSRRLSLDPELIQVLSAEPMVWSDSSLGCPQPGEAYTQQTVSGYHILLEANDQKYVYHTNVDQTVILCVEKLLPSIPITPDDIDDSVPWMPVD